MKLPKPTQYGFSLFKPASAGAVVKKLSGFSLIWQRGRSQIGFSLIEVLFAVTFLVLVGLAMMALNAASSRLVTTAELKVSAQALADEAINFISLQKKTLPTSGGSSFATTYNSCIDGGRICYLSCPATISQGCTLSQTRSTIQIGQSKLSYERQVTMKTVPTNQYLVKVTTSWGNGLGRQLTLSQLLQ